MKILILNGSPKGKYSITLQTTRYLEKLYPQQSFEVLNVGQKTKSLEKDFGPAREAIEKADVLLFSYPVYTFIAPYQLHRFIELLKRENMDLSGKFATQITTSKHFYDVTAHRYVQDNCADLGLRYIRGLSADMDDLLTDKGQKEARDFFDFLCWSVENGKFENPSATLGTFAKKPVSPAESTGEKTGDVVILADLGEKDTQLAAMIARFQAKFPKKTRIINLREYPFNGGCLGCFSCAVSGKCVHKDGFDEYLRKEIQTAESIVYAFAIRDHSMGALFKMYDDRNFCNGHRTVTIGMPVGYLISGDLSKEFNLQTIIEARAQVGTNFLAGVATDETDPDGEIDRLAETLTYALEHKYVPPQNFYGIGGMKIFRDLIWLMQGMMRADHKFYKAHGQYDFPQKKRGMMLKMYLVGSLLANEKIKAKMGNKMNEGMLMPYEKLFKEMDKK
ncbi:MAG: iron-sulfur protein [Ruminococcaceae bacterium]|nr:iron-sulfur protein [Oscillospiraceae bacterium]